MTYTFIKLKLIKLTLLGVFGAGVVATLIAKEMQRNVKSAEDTEH